MSDEKPICWLQNIIRYPEEQINEINQKINQLANEKQHSSIIDRRYERIKELKHIKNNIINRL